MKNSIQMSEPATARQKLVITRLCMRLGIKEPVELKIMNIAEAGETIRTLQRKAKNRK